MKLIHDMNSRWDILPASYWLKEVSVAEQFAFGGEAVIRKGHYKGEVVAIRQWHSPDHALWDSKEGQTILKV